MDRRLKRPTRLPKRLRDNFEVKNVPTRIGGTPPPNNIPFPERRVRRRVVIAPQATPPIRGNSVSPPLSSLRNRPGPSGLQPPVRSSDTNRVRRNLFALPISPRGSDNDSFNDNVSVTSNRSRRSTTPRNSPVQNVRQPSPRRIRRGGRPRMVRGINPVPLPDLPPNTYRPIRDHALSRVFTEIRKYKRNPVEISYDHNNIPHAVVRRKKSYYKVPSSYDPSNRPSTRIPLHGAFKSKTKILRRLKSLKQLKNRAAEDFVRERIENQINTFIKKYNTYRINIPGSQYPVINSEDDIP